LPLLVWSSIGIYVKTKKNFFQEINAKKLKTPSFLSFTRLTGILDCPLHFFLPFNRRFYVFKGKGISQKAFDLNRSQRRRKEMKKLLKSPILWGVLAALLVALPQATSYRFFGTDCTQVGVLEGLIHYPGMGPLTLYRFLDGTPEHMSALISEGFYPWFSTPQSKMNMCRHLSSALTALNHKISGLHPLGYALHSLLWYLVLIVLVGLLVRRIVPGPGGSTLLPVSFLTVLFFALATRNSGIVIYGGARWLLITAALGFAGLLAHLKWREQGWRPGRWLSLTAFLFALLAGEASLAVIAYLAAYELFGSPDSLKTKIKALLPVAGLVMVYLIVYRIMGYGTAYLALYNNPFQDPIAFISGLPLKLAAMLGEMFLGTISVLGLDPVIPANGLLTYLAGPGVLVVVILLFYPVWSSASPPQRRRYNWLIVGTVGAMFPLASVQPCSRVVLILSLGSSILLGAIVYYWWKKIRQNLKSLAWIGGVACIGLLGIHLVLSTYIWFSGGREFFHYLDQWEKYHHDSVLNEIKPWQKAIFLNGSGGDLIFSGYYHRKVNRLPMPESWWSLSYLEKKNRYHRTAANKLELEMLEGSVLDDPYTYYVRDPKIPFKKGEVLKFSGFQVTILEVNQKGPTRVEFMFDRSLDDDCYRFYKLQKECLQIITLPAPGQSLTL
jgi:hypothetical protein